VKLLKYVYLVLEIWEKFNSYWME